MFDLKLSSKQTDLLVGRLDQIIYLLAATYTLIANIERRQDLIRRGENLKDHKPLFTSDTIQSSKDYLIHSRQ